jgi:hypothetical protein
VKNATINTWMKCFSLSLKIILFSTLKAICREVARTVHVH